MEAGLHILDDVAVPELLARDDLLVPQPETPKLRRHTRKLGPSVVVRRVRQTFAHRGRLFLEGDTVLLVTGVDAHAGASAI